MKEVTDFKWDQMVIYGESSSNVEVSEVLGFRFRESVDLANGIAFLYKKQIVYKEDAPFDLEKPKKIRYNVSNKPEDPDCMVLYPNNATFVVVRNNFDGKFYYTVVPLKNFNRYKEEREKWFK